MGSSPLLFDASTWKSSAAHWETIRKPHGLSGYVRAYCGIEPENQHRSDGDAYATMLLLREICQKHSISPKQIKTVFASHFVDSLPPASAKIRKKKREENIESELPQPKATKRKPLGNRNRQKTHSLPEPASVNRS